MESIKHRLAIGVTGASGAIYARVLFERLAGLSDQLDACGVVFSNKAREVWNYELSSWENLKLPWPVYNPDDMFSPLASGSAKFRTMIICPCSMGTMGRIAAGLANDLITRAADVVLKERGRLILVLRETPYSLVHINNMKLLTEAGAIICPASPSFYSKPDSIEKLVATVTDRALELAGFQLDTYRWKI